jgi:small GTP-binding protein
MPSLEEQIRQIEEEIRKTPYNKKSAHHIGRLKAKLSRMRDEAEVRASARGGVGRSFAVKKSGNATVGIVGFPSVGKSTLLNRVTSAQSEVAPYAFTTLDVIPGMLEYKGAKGQILDMPGVIRGASRGRGRGREVLAVARAVDLIILMVDVFETNIAILVEELSKAGVRLNARPPDINISKRERGGLTINATVELTRLDETLIKDILREYGYINADIVLREDVDEDRLIDFLAGNRVYLPAFVVINKIDLVTPDYLRTVRERLRGWRVVAMSAEKGGGLEEFREALYDTLGFMRVYMKPQGKEADVEEPLVVRAGATVGMVCDSLHRDFRRNFRYANVWGTSAKFPGQTVGLEHVLRDQDIITIVVRK